MGIRAPLLVAGIAAVLAVSQQHPTAERTAPQPPADSDSTAVTASRSHPQLAADDVAVPVLMYHVIGDPPPDAPYPELFVGETGFAAQVSWLERNGFTAVTLSHVWEHWSEGRPLPAHPVVLTFDDGDLSISQRALPVLALRGWPGVLNLKLGNVSRAGIPAFQVRRLLAAGWELGAHTISHPDLRTLDDAVLELEVAGSRREIERRFGVRVSFFCYPAGRYDARVLEAVRRAGFVGATTTDPGFASPDEPFTLERIRVSRSDGLDRFAELLAGSG